MEKASTRVPMHHLGKQLQTKVPPVVASIEELKRSITQIGGF
jgi:hypothetical protein